MSLIKVRFNSEGLCQIEHAESGARIETDIPPEFGGQGRSFSSTDLVAAALGSCMATSLRTIAERYDLDTAELRIEVEKELSTSPKRIAALRVNIRFRELVNDDLREKLLAAARSCTVHRSLRPETNISIVISFGDAAAGERL